jgi:hypothetical protein
MSRSRGVALILVLLVTSFLSAMALGVAVAVSMAWLADGNFSADIALLNAADAGIALAAHELDGQSDWDAVLSGHAQGAFNDGAPSGTRDVPGGGRLSLSAATNTLNCGRPAGCTPGQLAATSRDRPWGANNPVWQPFIYGRVSDLASLEQPPPGYLVVWVADDEREDDGDPGADEALPGRPGRGVVRAHAEAFGPRGARRAVEAELVRVCRVEQAEEWCRPGIRVQSWREVRQLVP